MDPHPSTPSRGPGEMPLCAAAYLRGRVELKAWKRVAGRNFALIA
jgi:hypothetical protein